MLRVSRGFHALAGFALAGCSLFPSSAPMARGSGGSGGAGTEGGSAGMGGLGSDGGTRADAGSESGAGSGGTGGAGSGGTGGAPTRDASADGPVVDSGPGRRTYRATVADCLEQGQLNPDACLSYASTKDGPDEVWVDVKRASRKPFTGYLRFDLDGAITNHTVLSAELQLTVTSYAAAAGSAPDVFQTTPFDRSTLFTAAPADIGTTPLAPSPGLVASGQRVAYAIPTGLVAANGSVCLALVAAVADGVGFWNDTGPSPPELVVDYR